MIIRRKLRSTISIDGVIVNEGLIVNLEYAFVTNLAPRGVLVVISFNDMTTVVQPEVLDTVDIINDEIDFDEFRVKPHPSFEDKL